MILYGIPTCDICKKALKAIEAAGKPVTFRDVRAQPLTAAEIAAIVTEFGDRVINKQSTTYRSFSDFLRMSEPEAQIAKVTWAFSVGTKGRIVRALAPKAFGGGTKSLSCVSRALIEDGVVRARHGG